MVLSDMDGILRSFRTASRESVRLRLAMQGYFSGNAAPELEAYLRRRVRSVMEQLLREDDIPKLERLAGEGWLNPGLAEDGLDLAMRLRKTEGYVWLLRWKAEHCGFSDRDFSLGTYGLE